MLLREGKEHRLTRRAALPSFTTAALADDVNSLNLIIQKNIQLLPIGTKFSFYRFIQNTLFDVAAKIFVGLEPGTEKANNLNRLFAIVNAYFSVGDKMHLGLVFPGLRKLPFTIAGKAHSARQKLRELFVEEIKVRRGSKQEDMFSKYCNATDEEGNYLSDHEIEGHMVFLLFAAFDTTTSAITNMLFYLSKHEGWQHKIREEISSSVTEGASFGEVSMMKNAELVFKETLRLWPSLMVMFRRTTREVTIAGYDIPANTRLMLSPPFTHRMSDWWEEPFSFDPMRFTEDRAEHERTEYMYIPFGGGGHRCVGRMFALLNSRLYLNNIL